MLGQENKQLHYLALGLFIGMPLLWLLSLTGLFPFIDRVHSVAVNLYLFLFIIGVVLFAIDNCARTRSIFAAVVGTLLWTAFIVAISFVLFVILAFSAI